MLASPTQAVMCPYIPSMRCVTSRTVLGSIPGGVTWDFFPWFLPTKPCALRSTKSLKMSTRDFSWGKGG